MISVMANATLEFTNGQETVKAEIGFNRLPDWVGNNDYFKLCKKGLAPLITEFEGSSDKSLNEAEALRMENAVLRDKLRAQDEAKDQVAIEQVIEAAVSGEEQPEEQPEEKVTKKK